MFPANEPTVKNAMHSRFLDYLSALSWIKQLGLLHGTVYVQMPCVTFYCGCGACLELSWYLIVVIVVMLTGEQCLTAVGARPETQRSEKKQWNMLRVCF